MKKKVGLYGGTFDPIHLGHLNLALEIQEKHQLDEVWFCPAFLSPHKSAEEPASGAHRLAMVQLAIKGVPSFKAIAVEINRKGPSYTIDTLSHLVAQDPELEFFLILGADTIPSFYRWRQPEEIVNLAPLLIGRRTCELPEILPGGNPLIDDAIRQGITETRVLDISATDIRSRIKRGAPCLYLLPAEVLDYIYENGLYS